MMTEVIRELRDILPHHVDATEVALAAQPLWDALEECGLVDSFGGAECARVLPQAIELIYRQANIPPIP